MKLTKIQFAELWERLDRGQVVPFLGTGASRGAPETSPPSTSERSKLTAGW